jgi:hypothetical protein
MPIRIEYTEDRMGVILHHEGVVTSEELYDAVTQVYKDNRYPELKYWLGDRTNCTQYLPDEDCLHKIAEINKKESLRNQGMLLALVSPKGLEFGMSRMFQAYSEEDSFEVEVFRDRPSAEKWIRDELKGSK